LDFNAFYFQHDTTFVVDGPFFLLTVNSNIFLTVNSNSYLKQNVQGERFVHVHIVS